MTRSGCFNAGFSLRVELSHIEQKLNLSVQENVSDYELMEENCRREPEVI
jgi:hypothetical protein